MTFEHGGNNRMNGFNLSISVPPFERPTYSFVLDWEKQKEPKVPLSSNDGRKKNNINLDMERTIKDEHSSVLSNESLPLSLSSVTEKSQNEVKQSSSTDKRDFKHSELKQKIKKNERHDDTKNHTYDNLKNYDQSDENDKTRQKKLKKKMKSKKGHDSLTKLTVIIRYHTNNDQTVENVITNKVISSTTLIDALRFMLSNTTISLTGNDYGRLFILPDGRRDGKVRELPYDQNYYKLLTDFCKSGNECTLLLDVTSTFMKQVP
ncbi:E3 ubiquitin-protein ligase [Dirofilaria immitis]